VPSTTYEDGWAGRGHDFLASADSRVGGLRQSSTESWPDRLLSVRHLLIPALRASSSVGSRGCPHPDFVRAARQDRAQGPTIEAWANRTLVQETSASLLGGGLHLGLHRARCAGAAVVTESHVRISWRPPTSSASGGCRASRPTTLVFSAIEDVLGRGDVCGLGQQPLLSPVGRVGGASVLVA